MRSVDRSAHQFTLAVVVVAVFASVFAVDPGLAQSSAQGSISGLRFAIEVGERTTDPIWLTNGGRFVLPPGERRAIRAAAEGPGRRVYPSTTYRVIAGADWLTLDEPHPNMGTVEVVAAAKAGKGRAGTLEWVLEPGFLPADGVTRGTIEVVSSADVVATPPTPREIVTDLYRGILLRDPDPGAQGFIDTVERDGWEGVLRVAREIALSTESRSTVYQKGATNDARLEALYRHLQDRNRGSVPSEEWNRHLALLNQGSYDVVVNSLLALRPERLAGLARALPIQ